LWALRYEGAQVELFVRDLTRAKSMAEQFTIACHQLNRTSFDGFDIVINATPLGTRGEYADETPAVAQQLRNVRLAYDLVYNPMETCFLREARTAGCKTLSGIEMLLAQAAEQFKLWTNMEAPVDAMRDAARRALASHGTS
jgi:shikimate 5-dehydrogenase